jgi:DNA-binding CsgD family transcriptional regulator
MQEKLTQREQDILDLMLDGTPPKEIGHKLNISYHTVDFHRTKIYRKLGVKNIHELLSMYGQSTAVIPEEPAVSPKHNFDKRYKLLIFAAIIVIAVSILPVRIFLSRPSAPKTFTEKPFTIILNDNEPYGYTIRFQPPSLNGIKITAGDIYTLTYSFTSNADIFNMHIKFLDKTVEADNFWTMLSIDAPLKGNIKANIEYNGSLTIIANKTASSTDPNANLLVFETYPYTSDKPTISFTKFELVKNT